MMYKKLGIVFLFLFMHFLSVLFNQETVDFKLLELVYILSAITLFGLGYLEIVNIKKLGFGITRKSIFITFSKTLIFAIIFLFIFSLYNALIYIIVYEDKHFYDFFNIGMVIYLSLVIFSFGQIGMLFGNIKINKYIGVSIFLGLFILNFVSVFYANKFLIVNIILGVISISLIFINYYLLENAKVERGL